MKLLLSLILLFTIAFNCGESLKLGVNNNVDFSKLENKVGQQQCFTSSSNFPTGYSTSFVQIAFNANTPTSNGDITQTSYMESGTVDIDFVGGQLYVDFEMDTENSVTKGKLWGFNGNNTQYVNIELNGNEYCFLETLTYSIPVFENLKYVSDAEIGSVECDLFMYPSILGNSTNQYLFVDKSDCSLISASAQNANGSPSGNSLTNFYYYEPSADSSNFQLPSICLNSPILSQPKLKSLLNKIPKIN
ncbi:hypothetical protein DDB_G0276603 [Dictyostelium discoideum AX4]|uniref:Uncharacterized protein n=1 Tax=Dictyostelium discoideum TaxID=44689 RepID=Q86HE8_DICDI|nr:hypothetical protein DDB_G0276603 [Dictyostelium discoideum AX4]EAL69144.1 hypothetical protein DDB_G0276603 [Dictyostelium discoideum AX4]|eukprot:XP_643068.1 hypothetical protein DDB_G0276603 [Dictyostelium discoideum AX4]